MNEPRVRFTIFGKPQPQQQNRAVPVMRKTPDGRWVPVMKMLPSGKQVPVMRFPNPKETVNWRSDAKSAALAAMNGRDGELMQGPVRMDVTIYLGRPQSRCRKRDPKGPVWAARTPDRSNIMKSLEDSLQGVVYVNDAQIVDGTVRKFYCPQQGYGDIRPRVEVSIEEVMDEVEVGVASQESMARLL